MVQVKIVLDTRRKKADGTYSVIFRITNIKKVYTITSGIAITEDLWDISNNEVSKAHPNFQSLNTSLSKKYYQIQRSILKLEEEGTFSYDELKLLISDKPKLIADTSFKAFSQKLIDDMMEVKRTGNAIIYQTAVNRFLGYCKNPKIKFSQINYSLIDGFIQNLTLAGLKQNSIGNYLRSLRAIYNKAIKAKIVDRSCYPFYDISIKTEKTQKRAVLKKDITVLEKLNIDVGSKEWHARNYFLLCFYLIGMSFTDLAYLTKNNLNDGRIAYRRRKTHKLYSIKLFKKAEEILERYNNGNRKYLLPVLNNEVVEDTLISKKLIAQWIKTTNKYLRRIVNSHTKGLKLTTYVARHTWATTAKKLGYSNELIAEALGHENGNRVTNIYLDSFDQEVVDAMHEKVIR